MIAIGSACTYRSLQLAPIARTCHEVFRAFLEFFVQNHVDQSHV